MKISLCTAAPHICDDVSSTSNAGSVQVGIKTAIVKQLPRARATDLISVVLYMLKSCPSKA